jgi:LuxR family maltose regulon positive regulatory protein
VDGTSRDHPVLITKLHAPQKRPDTVARPRLTDRLNSGLRSGQKLAVLSAPPGYGKTTLLLEWLAGIDLPHAWLSLDEGDNDPVRFLTNLVGALQRVDPSIGGDLKPWLGRPLLSSVESQTALLINDLSAVERPFLLILDEFQVIHEKAIEDALAGFLERQPSTMFVAVSTRSEPGIPLPLLRARGQVTEFGASDLRFTVREASAFFSQTMGLGLSQQAVAALTRRTEGWIAGLQLAALSLLGKTSGEIGEFVQGFSGSHRLVVDFLAEEVLKRQSPAVRTFLLETSILDRLTGPLCEAVTGEPGGAATLRHIEQSNLFLLPLDYERDWFRYHTTFAEFLRTQLAPGEAQALHDRAARWFEAQQLLPEAVAHAHASGDHAAAARLIAQAADGMFRQGHLTQLLSWLDDLPEPLVQDTCELATYKGWALSLTQRLQEADRYASAAASTLQDDAPTALAGRVFSLRAGLASQRNEIEAGIELAHSAIPLLGEGDPFFLSFTYSALGNCHEMSGDMVAAEPAYLEALRIWRAEGDQVAANLALFDVVNTLNALGRRREGVELCRQVVGTTSRAGEARAGKALLDTGYLGWSLLAYEANELDFARAAAQRALSACQKLGFLRGELLALRLLCRIRAALQEFDAALEIAQAGLRRASHLDLWEAEWFNQLQADLRLQRGDWPAARDWVRAQGFSLDGELKGFREASHLTYARVLLASDQVADATRYLKRLKESAERGGRKRSLVTIHTLQALAQAALGYPRVAVRELQVALELAASGDYLRAILDEGPPAERLVREVMDQVKDSHTAPFLEQLSAAILSSARPASAASGDDLPLLLRPTASPPQEPLTRRELELLRLMGDGLSNESIAERLGVSVSTVKKHINHIFDKLDAHDRTQAVLRAHQHRLI